MVFSGATADAGRSKFNTACNQLPQAKRIVTNQSYRTHNDNSNQCAQQSIFNRRNCLFGSYQIATMGKSHFLLDLIFEKMLPNDSRQEHFSNSDINPLKES